MRRSIHTFSPVLGLSSYQRNSVRLGLYALCFILFIITLQGWIKRLLPSGLQANGAAAYLLNKMNSSAMQMHLSTDRVPVPPLFLCTCWYWGQTLIYDYIFIFIMCFSWEQEKIKSSLEKRKVQNNMLSVTWTDFSCTTKDIGWQLITTDQWISFLSVGLMSC